MGKIIRVKGSNILILLRRKLKVEMIIKYILCLSKYTIFIFILASFSTNGGDILLKKKKKQSQQLCSEATCSYFLPAIPSDLTASPLLLT